MNLQILVIVILALLPFVVSFDVFFVSKKMAEFGLLKLQKKIKSKSTTSFAKRFMEEKSFLDDIPVPGALHCQETFSEIREKGYEKWILSQSLKKPKDRIKPIALYFFAILAISTFTHLEDWDVSNEVVQVSEIAYLFLIVTSVAILISAISNAANGVFSIKGVFYSFINGLFFSFYLGGGVFLGMWLALCIRNFTS